MKKGNADRPVETSSVYQQFHGWTVISDKQATIDAFEQASDSAKRTLSEDKTFIASAMDKAGDGIFRAYVNGPSVMAAARNVLGDCRRRSVPQEARHARLAADGAACEVRRNRAWDTTDARHARYGSSSVGISTAWTAAWRSSCRRMRCSTSRSTGRRDVRVGSGGNRSCSSSAPRGSDRRASGRLGTILEGENALYVPRRRLEVMCPDVTFIASPRSGVTATRRRSTESLKRYAGARSAASP